MLFWTELKQLPSTVLHHPSFRVVLFWTELKRIMLNMGMKASFRVVLFWTELKRGKRHEQR